MYEVSKIVEFIESKSGMMVSRGHGEGGNGGLLINGYRFSVKQDEALHIYITVTRVKNTV